MIQLLEDGGLEEIVLELALDQAGANLGDVGVVLDQPGDDHADVVDAAAWRRAW